jgi:putative hydrolase of the HAD superfamily
LKNKALHKYKAVIFDLGGTLTCVFAWSEVVDAAKEIAAFISAPVDDFVRIWFEQGDGLATGVFPSYQDFIKHICRQLSLKVPDDLLDRAAEISLAVGRREINMPRDGAIEVLSYLKANGYKTGLITDCEPDVPALWSKTPFAPFIDVAVYSCTVGMNKNNPEIFKLATEKLEVKPKNCIYIADGNRNELANAKKLGMYAVRLLVPGEINDSPVREDWHGPVISSLKEVLTLVK